MTLVVLHGFTGSPGSWRSVIERLPPNTTVLAPYLAGHGPEPVLVDRFQDEVARLCALVEERATTPVHLAGYSMGGRIGLAMLASRPELFRSATLIGARNGLSEPAERAERRRWEAGWIEMLGTRGLEPFVESWESLPMWADLAGADPARLRAQRRERLSHTAAGLASAMGSLGLAGMPDLAAALPDAELPVTLMTGARDEKFARLADRLAELLPRARRLTVAGAGHNLLVERPEAVAEALTRELVE